MFVTISFEMVIKKIYSSHLSHDNFIISTPFAKKKPYCDSQHVVSVAAVVIDISVIITNISKLFLWAHCVETDNDRKWACNV